MLYVFSFLILNSFASVLYALYEYIQSICASLSSYMHIRSQVLWKDRCEEGRVGAVTLPLPAFGIIEVHVVFVGP